ncbi:hypothetical protein SAMN06297251_10434 [Fulvimarina manganoxydans]|uniref:Uncharacterized protein n=1 Tax=Fulvimarina manganoxydans TaxID=937218 RepID=A0A1W2A9C3_9HYPH|nr:hypothetical protein SAMN06297251_10434 [Fulvimarina manganoxydans]
MLPEIIIAIVATGAIGGFVVYAWATAHVRRDWV